MTTVDSKEGLEAFKKELEVQVRFLRLNRCVYLHWIALFKLVALFSCENCLFAHDQAQQIVRVRMPTKVLSLSKLYESNPVFSLSIKDIHANFQENSGPWILTLDNEAVQSSKRRKTDPTETKQVAYPPNATITEIIDLLKPVFFANNTQEVMELIHMVQTIKIWIQLNIPKIEDGNNFGVSIQVPRICPHSTGRNFERPHPG